MPKFTHPNTRLRGVLADRLLHQVVSIVVKPLKKAAEVGRMMSDPLGNLKHCFTPLAAYIADTPEQRVVACVTGNASAVTMAVTEQFGDSVRCAPRTASITRRQLIAVKKKTRASNLTSYFKACRQRQLNGVSAPFWLDWALAEPSSFITPEPLHQYFKMSWDHDRKWCSRILGAEELDFRFTLLQTCSGDRHFPDGITTLKQTSMRLHREVQRYIVGVVAGGIPKDALAAIRALTDFRYRSQAPRLTDKDIVEIQSSLQEFHDKKFALMEAGARGSLDHWRIPKLEMMLAVAPSIPSMGALGQWSADVTEHAHIDVIKDPARSGNNQNFDGQICRYLDRQEKCQLFAQATAIRQFELHGDSDSSDASDDEDNHPNARKRKITDYFERASALRAGKFPTAPRPYRTFASPATAFHLSSKPTMTNMTIDDAAQLYELPDFKPAIADYLDRHHPNFTHTIGGRRQSTPDCQLQFDRIQIWSKMRIQLHSSYDSQTLLPPQGLHAAAASAKWPFGRYDTVIISGDGNKDWPHNGLRGETVVPYISCHSANYMVLQGHEIAQLRLIFKPISNLLPDIFFAYVQRFTISSVDQDAGMHVLKRALRNTGERVGDVIPLFQIRSPAHIIPRFGQAASSRLCSSSSNELSSTFWLNKYWTKELFHSISL